MKILLAGATGLVGSHLLKLLESDSRISEIHVLARRASLPSHPKLIIHVSELGRNYLSQVAEMKFDAVISCLGTTIKVAGSQSEFKKVDLDAVVDLARFTMQSNSGAFLVVSGLGANPKALSFYSRVKGEMEVAVSRLAIPSISILRPSLLLGERSTFRMGEKIGEVVLGMSKGLLQGSLKKYQAIPAEQVAQALLALSLAHRSGVHVYESDRIVEYAKSGVSFSESTHPSS